MINISKCFSSSLNKFIAGIVTLLALNGCTGAIANLATTPATLSYTTASHRDLLSLPAPLKKIPVAVYNFRDQTGQYKPMPNTTSFSTAVTQGATSMLVQALNDSNWFIPIEREGLQNILTERKIVKAAMESGGQDKDKQAMPPLLFANVLLEGGIISYETNLLTGGVGAKYFGVGGHVNYQLDRVTLYLRAIDVRSGRVLKSVSTSKSIFSRGIDVGLFRFVSPNRLLELETGLTTNEPAQMCVMDALEKAVTALIVEGIFDKLWALQNQDDINALVIRNYLREKNERELLISPQEGVLTEKRG